MKFESEQVLSTEKARRFFLPMIAAGSLALAGLPAVAFATVFHARDEALKLAFPTADSVEARDTLLTKEQHEAIEQLAKAPLESDLVTVYAGSREGAVEGYGVFDTHTVRTFPETILVVIAPDGAVRAVHVLAFHEPQEYLPNSRWFDQFKGKPVDEEMQVGRGLAAVTGSTLSTRAVSAGIRRALAIWSIVIGGK